MQIDATQLANILKTDQIAETGTNETFVKEAKPSSIKEPLRTISMANPTYNKSDLNEKTVVEELEEQLSSGSDASLLHNQMAVYSQTTSPEDYKKMQEDGFDPMDTEAHTIVTVTDKIKIALAKGGADLSELGGISDAKLEAIAGSTSAKVSLEQQIKNADLPVEEATLTEAQTALVKMEQLQGPLTEESIAYLLKNEMFPTIDAIYQATYATGGVPHGDEQSLTRMDATVGSEISSREVASGAMEVTQENGSVQASQTQNALLDAYASVITSAAMDVTDETLSDCAWMMERDIPVTKENLIHLEELRTVDTTLPTEEATTRIVDALTDGKRAGEATLLPEGERMQQARALFDAQTNTLSNIKDARVREEARMMLSVEANYALLKNGVAIDTQEIQETIDALKSLEDEYLHTMLKQTDEVVTEENVKTYQKVQESLVTFATAPAAVLAQLSSGTDTLLKDAVTQAKSLSEQVTQMQKRYETVQTAPRADLGDSIQKAFANVDDILEDEGFEITEGNRRAVRILAYNEMELSSENIERVRSVDAEVQRMYKEMKPASVLSMIREGVNPLDLSIKDLANTASQMGQESSDTAGHDSEKFASFLWKLERAHEITEEERASYIGIYRMIHQVEAGDGAAIGALIAQEADVTLRNLMTAVRSTKHSGRSYAVDDSFGEMESFDVSTLSITDQAEMAFQANCLYDARDVMSAARMQQFTDENAYMDLTPEQFKSQLEEMVTKESSVAEEIIQQEAADDASYAEDVRGRVAEALRSETQVYELLERFDLPTTPSYLSGMAQLLADHNSVYRNLNRYAKERGDAMHMDLDIGISDLIEDLIEDYGEACKTPKDMADAQHKLEETAENVMKNMLVEKEVRSIDVRGMKLVMTQIEALGKISEKSETYNLPILVEDQVGNLSLKIVRGSEEKGLVDVALDMNETGVITGSFRYEGGEINGNLSFENRDVADLFTEHMPAFAAAMQEACELPVSFRFAADTAANVDDFYEEKDPGFAVSEEKDEVSTKVLYGIARSFIDEVSELLSGQSIL